MNHTCYGMVCYSIAFPIGKIAFKYKGNMDFYHEIDGVSGEIYLPLRDIFQFKTDGLGRLLFTFYSARIFFLFVQFIHF